MLALAFDDSTCEGDLVYSGGRMVDEGFDLDTAVLLSLLCDAPAQDGDPLPDDAPRRGFWGDAYETGGEILGSRLWLLEDAVASQENATRAKSYAAEALRWLLAGRYVRAIDYETRLGDEAIELTPIVTKKDGTTVALGPFEVT